MEIKPTYNININKVSSENNAKNCPNTKKSQEQRTTETYASTPAFRAYALSKIEIDKLKNIQSTMQEIFLNQNIGIGEAKIMLERYKELEKIENKNDYIKAVFEEAKQNYGFGNSKIALKIQQPEFMQGYTGAADDCFLEVQIRNDIDRKDVIKTIHHEFRHHKQKYLAYRYSPKLYMSALNKKIETITDGKVKNIWKDTNKLTTWLDENLNEDTTKYTFPKQYTVYAIKCINAMRNHVEASENHEGYWNNFAEKDARKAGELIQDLLARY